jgi:hypothetical protein
MNPAIRLSIMPLPTITACHRVSDSREGLFDSDEFISG